MCEDHLVEWAKWTEEEFDSIVVVLEDPENIPSPTLDAFFASLSHLRSRHHLPIDVILMDAMPGGMGDRLSRLRQPSFHNAGGGEGGGAVIQEVFLPEPGVQFGRLCAFYRCMFWSLLLFYVVLVRRWWIPLKFALESYLR